MGANDSRALRYALAEVLPDAVSMTVHMCWHQGQGHHYPVEVMEAAARLRQRHAGTGSVGCDDDYTSLTFTPTLEDRADFVEVAPFCDFAYALDSREDLLAEVSGEGITAHVQLTPDQHTQLCQQYPQVRTWRPR